MVSIPTELKAKVLGAYLQAAYVEHSWYTETNGCRLISPTFDGTYYADIDNSYEETTKGLDKNAYIVLEYKGAFKEYSIVIYVYDKEHKELILTSIQKDILDD